MRNLSKADLVFFASVGMTTGETAKALGLADVTVRKWSRRHGVKFPFRPSILRRFHKSYYKEKSGCWIWTGTMRGNGYGCIGDAGLLISAHRYSYEIFIGPIAEGKFICHSCDNPSCVAPDHLFAGTPKDNMDDMRAKGRSAPPRGERHHAAKLSETDIANIKCFDLTGKEASQVFGVCESTISKIRNRKAWAHVN